MDQVLPCDRREVFLVGDSVGDVVVRNVSVRRQERGVNRVNSLAVCERCQTKFAMNLSGNLLVDLQGFCSGV